MLTLWSDDITGVDGIVFEIALLPGRGTHLVVEFTVRVVGDDISLVHPTSHVCGIGGFHQSDESTLSPCVGTVDRTVDGDDIIHAVEAVSDFSHTGCPVTAVAVVGGAGSKSHLCADLIEFHAYPGWQGRHGGSKILPVDEVGGTAAMKMTMSCLRIAKTGIGAVHIVISVFGFHDRGVVHIGKSPPGAVLPTGDTAIVVGISRGRPGDLLILDGGERHILGVDVGGGCLGIGAHMVGRGGLQSGEGHTDIIVRSGEFGVVDGRIGCGAIAYATALDVRAYGSGCDRCSGCGNGRNHRSRHRHAGGCHAAASTLIFAVIAATSNQQTHTQHTGQSS